MGLGCQSGKKPSYLRFRHFCRMPLVVEKDKSLDPMNIGFLGSRTIVARADGLANLIEELCSRCARGRGTGRDRAPADHFESLVGEAPHGGGVHGNLLVVN